MALVALLIVVGLVVAAVVQYRQGQAKARYDCEQIVGKYTDVC